MVAATTFTSSGGGDLSAQWQNRFQIERWATGLLTPLPCSLRLAKLESGHGRFFVREGTSPRPQNFCEGVVVTTFGTCEGGRDHLFQTLL